MHIHGYQTAAPPAPLGYVGGRTVRRWGGIRPGAEAMRGERFNLEAAVAAGTLWLAALAPAVAAAPTVAPVDVVLVVEDSGAVRSAKAAGGLTAFNERLLNDLTGEARAALITFDDVATPLVPLSRLDAVGRERISVALASLRSTASLSNSAAGLERAIYELTAASADGARRAIVLQHVAPIGVGDAAKDAAFRRWAIEVLAGKAAKAGIEIHSLSLGPRADAELGALLAERTGGLAQVAPSGAELGAALAALSTRLNAIDQTTDQARPAVASSAERPFPAAPAAPVAASLAAAPSLPAATPIAPPVVESVVASIAEPVVESVAERPAERVVEPVVRPAPAEVPEASPRVATADEIRALEDLPAPAAGPVTAMAAAEQSLAATTERLRSWPADPAVWRVTAYVLVALVLAGLMIGFVRRRRNSVPAVASAAGDGPRLVDVNAVSGRRVYPLGDKIARISRSPGADTANVVTVHIPQDVISRAHAFVDRRDGAHWVTDPGSNNGTYVNDERVDGSHKLQHGDRVRFATFEFLFEDPPEADASTRVGKAFGQALADDGDATQLLGQAETEFMPAARGGERTLVAPSRPDGGQGDQPDADADATIVRPAR